MDRPGMMERPRWYRRLQVQLWLWAILPLTLVLVAVSFAGVRHHQDAMRGFVAERDTALAELYAQRVDEAVDSGRVSPGGAGLAEVLGGASVGAGGVVYVVDEHGHVLYHPQPGLVDDANPAVRQATAWDSGATEGRLADGTPTLASFATVGHTGWSVLVEEPTANVIVPVLRFSSTVPGLVLAAGALSLIVIYFSLRTIAHPLQGLARQAALVTGGDLSGLQRDMGGVEEIRQLQQALRDMVERIRRYQEGMREYIEGITAGQEAERARLSRELHDGTVQGLIAIGQRLQLAQRALERKGAPAAQQELAQTRSALQATLEDLRRTIRALRPVYLDDLGFVPALEALIGELRSASLAAELVVLGEPRRLRPEVELAAFRVAQEALNNALRHAHANQVTLLIRFGERELSLAVEDDGVGFALPDSPDAFAQTGHFGLVGMRERTLLPGGEFDIESQPGRGTRVTARFPV